MRYCNLLVDRLPTLRTSFDAMQKILQFRQFFRTGQRFSVPNKPCPRVVLSLQPPRHTSEHDMDLTGSEPPEQFRGLARIAPGFEKGQPSYPAVPF